MNLSEFYPTVIVALGPPPKFGDPRSDGGDAYEKEFILFCRRVDFYEYRGRRYPIGISEQEDQYRKLYVDFRWWYNNRN